jgi:uncharacterized protein YbbK (DUF523 family)/uncharacterized protein YbgA (DUF1722 family)
MMNFPKPVVVVSACLEFEKVRYDGQVIPCKIVRDLEPFVEYIRVCPEFAIGLGVPRDPIRIVKIGGEKRLIQPKTKEDITEKMNNFTKGFIQSLPDVDGFIFKSKSPTIGLRGIKVYAGIEQSAVLEQSSGFFADQIIQAFPDYPMEEDDRLRNATIRDNFLVKLFTFAAFRRTKEEQSMEALREFHEKNRFLFMSHSTEHLTKLDTLLKDNKSIKAVFKEYDAVLKKLLAQYPSSDSRIRAVLETFNRFSEKVSHKESTFFTEVIEEYKQNKICFLCLLELLKSYALRFEDGYVENQTLLEPYPKALMVAVEPDRDRDYWKLDH